MTKLNTPLEIKFDNTDNDSGLMLVYDSEGTLLLEMFHNEKEEHTALAELIRRANAFEELVKLLEKSKCPDVNCDGNGITFTGAKKVCCNNVRQIAEEEYECCLHPNVEPVQCQWCDERKQLLIKLNEKEK